MSALSGTGPLLALALRRDRVLIPLSALALTAYSVGSAKATVALYSDAASAMKDLGSVLNSPSTLTLYGPATTTSLQGLSIFKTLLMGSVFVGLLAASASVQDAAPRVDPRLHRKPAVEPLPVARPPAGDRDFGARPEHGGGDPALALQGDPDRLAAPPALVARAGLLGDEAAEIAVADVVVDDAVAIRAQAGGENFYAALELTLDKMESRLRRAKTRREIHYGLRTPTSVAEATANGVASVNSVAGTVADADVDHYAVDDHEPGQVVRVKEHSAVPMTVDDALYEMELVGHDFFLFHDKETDRPSVVYRRHAFDYGLLRLT